MSTQVVLLGGFISLLGLAVWLASKSGSRAAKIEALKAELERTAREQARAQGIMDHVRHTDIERVREKLRQTR